MVALALVFLVIAALLTLAIIPASSGESADLELFGANMTMSVAGIYVTGLIAGAIAVLSARLLRFGVVREWRQRKRIKDLERRAEAAGAGTPAAALPEQRVDDEPAAAIDESEPAAGSNSGQDADDATSDGWSVPGEGSESGSGGVSPGGGRDESARHETP